MVGRVGRKSEYSTVLGVFKVRSKRRRTRAYLVCCDVAGKTRQRDTQVQNATPALCLSRKVCRGERCSEEGVPEPAKENM
jgi:hypothetical protein